MNYINNYQKFLEQLINPNSPQGYVNSLTNRPKLNQQNQKNQQQKPTDEVDAILQNTEEQKQKIIARKDAIEKGLLNNIRGLEPENQKDVETQVKDYKTQVTEFDKTVAQIGKLNQTLKKSNRTPVSQPSMMKSREQNKI